MVNLFMFLFLLLCFITFVIVAGITIWFIFNTAKSVKRNGGKR